MPSKANYTKQEITSLINHILYQANSPDLCAHQQLTGAVSICTQTSFLLSVPEESHSQHYFPQYYCNNRRQHITIQAALHITTEISGGFICSPDFETLQLCISLFQVFHVTSTARILLLSTAFIVAVSHQKS